MRKPPLIVGNWKLNPSSKKEALSLFQKIAKHSPKQARMVIAPPLPFLTLIANKYRGKKIALASQDVSSEEQGAHTGEVSASIIKDIGATYCIIGHSERRMRGESDSNIKRKVRLALDTRLTPIVCVGEKERDSEGLYLNTLKEQIEASLGEVLPPEIGKVVIAYEPLWAIGNKSSGAIEPKDLYTIAIYIRKVLLDRFGDKGALTPVLYGGSVDVENAKALIKDGHMQGLLVGRESLKPDDFIKIARSVSSK